jgi:adenosylhomocysteine nucleosidase
MRILVTFAVDAEFAPWRSRHPFVPYEFDDAGRRREFDLFRANIGAHQVTVLLTGMGAENAGNAMRTISFATYDLCISTGLAGALDAALKPGDIVVGRASRTCDLKVASQGEAGLVPLAVACGARAVDVFLTSDTIVMTAAEKETLSASGSVVEMETTHILEAARRQQLPAAAVRAISDAADEDLPVDFQQIADSRGRVKLAGLLKELLLHPHRIPLLIQFARQSRSAAVSLADFLDRYIPVVAKQWFTVRVTRTEEVSAT